ncbi:MAG: hypothetical protein VXY93_14110, partial [Pseudomonadota bacterium]|nr:hypothetical protein [Pseudomonadota bacterium]
IGIDSSDNLKLGWGGSVDEIHFGIAGIGEPMILDSTGNLGIGTDNPQSLLSLHQSGGGFEINANSGSNNARLLSYDRAASAYREMTFQALSYGFEVGGAERFDIDSNGHFKVTNGNAANWNTIQRHSTSLYCGVRIQDADGTQRMQFGVAGGANQIVTGAAQHDVCLKAYAANLLLATNSTERLRITSDGNVQINQDSKFLQIGAGQDLDLHHNGTNSYIRNKTGDLHIRPLVNEEGIILKPNAEVQLYHNNNIRAYTGSDGFYISRVNTFSN